MITLTVAPMSATIAKDTDLIGKMDPYVTIEVAGKTERTKTVEAGGKNPRWADRFTFSCNQGDTITLRIYDDDVGRDDFIGELRLSVLEVMTQGGFINQTYPFASGNNSGTLTLQVSAQQSGVAGLSTGTPIATSYVAPAAVGAAGLGNAGFGAAGLGAAGLGAAGLGMGAYQTTQTTTTYNVPNGTASYVTPGAYGATSTSGSNYGVPYATNNAIVGTPVGTNQSHFTETKSITGQYVNGLAPFNSTVYTPNPYLTHPQDHKPTCGCC